jgi:prephenate dehydrogenase
VEDTGLSSQNASLPFKRVTIIGVGLIGGSVAAALKALPLDRQPLVRGVDISERTIATALQRGYLDEALSSDDERVASWLGAGGSVAGRSAAGAAAGARAADAAAASAPSASEVAASEIAIKTTATSPVATEAAPSDLVILATPVDAAGEWLQRIEAAGYAGVLTDVASTKGQLTGQAAEILSHPERYIPGHPMAGSEVNGIEGVRATLFNGAHWILCPDANSEPEAFLRLHDFVSALGARSITVPRDEHDEAIALVSHVPHMVASALMRLVGSHVGESREILRLAAGGFKDTTRIAAGSPGLWSGIALDNREALVRNLGELRAILNDFESAIARGDERGLRALLDAAAQLRKAIPATWVPDSERLVELRIPMSNRSGVIAKVTGFAGKAGCNIQSIDIDHINEGTAILELILTDEGDLGRFTRLLIDAGFDMSLRPLLPDAG